MHSQLEGSEEGKCPAGPMISSIVFLFSLWVSSNPEPLPLHVTCTLPLLSTATSQKLLQGSPSHHCPWHPSTSLQVSISLPHTADHHLHPQEDLRLPESSSFSRLLQLSLHRLVFSAHSAHLVHAKDPLLHCQFRRRAHAPCGLML